MRYQRAISPEFSESAQHHGQLGNVQAAQPEFDWHITHFR